MFSTSRKIESIGEGRFTAQLDRASSSWELTTFLFRQEHGELEHGGLLKDQPERCAAPIVVRSGIVKEGGREERRSRERKKVYHSQGRRELVKKSEELDHVWLL